MTLNFIGTKEIYHEAVHEVYAFLHEDSESGVAKLKALLEKKTNTKEFLNGSYYSYNILMLAVYEANISLVKYIVEHTNKNILDLQDSVGRTALFQAAIFTLKAPLEKVLACVQILIEAGSNMDLRTGFISLPTPTAPVLHGNNLLGHIVTNLNDGENTPEQMEKFKMVAGMLVTYGASCYMRNLEIVDFEATGNGTQKQDASKYIATLKEAQNAWLNWPHTRLLFAGSRDTNSPLSKLPDELRNLIFQQYMAQ